jgi:hypothetical protein
VAVSEKWIPVFRKEGVSELVEWGGMKQAGPPMTLGNMRANGVRTIAAYCDGCHHQGVLDVEAYPDDTPVPSFAPRLVCTRCGLIGADARPNWSEHRAAGTGRSDPHQP